MIEYITSAAVLVQFAFLFYALGFLTRDELWLRILVLTGTVFYLLYYFFIDETPLWEAIATTTILGLINTYMIFILILERTTFAMDDLTTRVFEKFDTLTPGQFRKVIKLATTTEVATQTVLTQQGQSIDRLHLVVDGSVNLEKSGQNHAMQAPLFLGEISFLLDDTASANVTVPKDATVVSWAFTDLHRLMDKAPAIRNAIIALFSRDLAQKLGRSAPANRPS